MRWTERIKLEIIVEDVYLKNGRQRYVESIIPNVPVDLPSLQVTMTSLTLPLTPRLNSKFVTDGIDTAIWRDAMTPNLRCASWDLVAY
ncbi:hypothetical protein ANCDUO_13220 [Ancylostoma duodenale]|uniref:Phlebovirus glycoprotein G2 fusion domain-containing protein n=1 Tax=Ancylostoma duodenale TaxID=51022 RepID=A0A0C2CJH7_9BILA|nr:hypothetical protein ANCDUO_13220 [Ancylostoma duodenale]